MPSYTVTVATGSQWFAGTDDYIYLSLVGSTGCSERHLLDKAFYNDFERGAVSGGGAGRGRRTGPSIRQPSGARQPPWETGPGSRPSGHGPVWSRRGSAPRGAGGPGLLPIHTGAEAPPGRGVCGQGPRGSRPAGAQRAWSRRQL